MTLRYEFDKVSLGICVCVWSVRELVLLLRVGVCVNFGIKREYISRNLYSGNGFENIKLKVCIAYI